MTGSKMSSRMKRRRTVVGLLMLTCITVSIWGHARQAQASRSLQTKVNMLEQMNQRLQDAKDRVETRQFRQEQQYRQLHRVDTIATNTIPTNQSNQPDLSNVPERYRGFVLSASKESGLSPQLIAALGQQESNWDCNMLGADQDTGCLQILPATGAWAMEEMGFSGSLWNPETNIRVGAWVLATFTKMEHGDVSSGLASYNAGPQWRQRAPVAASRYAERVLDRIIP